jgi:hypothetical protein
VQPFPSLQGVPLAAPKQALGATLVTEALGAAPGLNSPKVMGANPGATFASKRKLYSVPHLKALASGFTA